MNTTQNYVNRLKSCGFSDADALRLTRDFIKEYHGEKELVEFIEQQEKDNLKNVGEVQCKSNCKQCGGLCHKSSIPCIKRKLG